MGPILPLSFIPSGKNGLIRKVAEGENVRNRLTAMGFVSGEVIKVLRNDHCGPLIISILDSRIAIGRGMARKILVEELGQEDSKNQHNSAISQ